MLTIFVWPLLCYCQALHFLVLSPKRISFKPVIINYSGGVLMVSCTGTSLVCLAAQVLVTIFAKA